MSLERKSRRRMSSLKAGMLFIPCKYVLLVCSLIVDRFKAVSVACTHLGFSTRSICLNPYPYPAKTRNPCEGWGFLRVGVRIVMFTGYPRANFCPPVPIPAETCTRNHGCGIPADNLTGAYINLFILNININI